MKATRSERHAITMARKQRQIDWLRIMVLCCCLHRMHPFSLVKKVGMSHEHANKTHAQIISHASEIIFRAVNKWWEHLLYVKYRQGFTDKLAKHKLRIELGFRIGRKRRAVKKITALLVACQGYQKVIGLSIHYEYTPPHS